MPPPESPPRRSARPPSFASLSSAARPPLHPTRQDAAPGTFDHPPGSEAEAIRLYRGRASLRRYHRPDNPPSDHLDRLRTLAFEAVHDADIGSDVLASGYRSQAIRRRLLRAAALNSPRRRRLAETMNAPTPPIFPRRRLPDMPGLFPLDRMDLDLGDSITGTLLPEHSDSDMYSPPRTRSSKRRKFEHQVG
jgi:hypothetical protein